jgi:hypothetical protein
MGIFKSLYAYLLPYEDLHILTEGFIAIFDFLNISSKSLYVQKVI